LKASLLIAATQVMNLSYLWKRFPPPSRSCPQNLENSLQKFLSANLDVGDTTTQVEQWDHQWFFGKSGLFSPILEDTNLAIFYNIQSWIRRLFWWPIFAPKPLIIPENNPRLWNKSCIYTQNKRTRVFFTET